jgi:hypothetical protein
MMSSQKTDKLIFLVNRFHLQKQEQLFSKNTTSDFNHYAQ